MPRAPDAAPKAERTRRRIVDVAARTFRMKGYAATRLSDIAAAAGTRAGSLYYHFDSKAELLDEVLEQGHRAVENAVHEQVAALGPDASCRERVRAAIHAHLRGILLHLPYAAANIHLHEQIPDRIRRRHIRKHRDYAAYWQALLRAAQKSGEIRAGVDVSMVRLNLFGMMNWAIEWYRPGRLAVADVAESMYCGMFEGIAAPGRGRPQRGARRRVRREL